jgi:hypothetical protein
MKKLSVSPFLKSVKLSNENAENVVNPPQKPIIKKVRNSLELKLLLNAAENIPIAKLPKIFVINVEIGKEFANNFATEKLNKKRKTLPNPPPTKTNNIDLIINYII